MRVALLVAFMLHGASAYNLKYNIDLARQLREKTSKGKYNFEQSQDHQATVEAKPGIRVAKKDTKDPAMAPGENTNTAFAAARAEGLAKGFDDIIGTSDGFHRDKKENKGYRPKTKKKGKGTESKRRVKK